MQVVSRIKGHPLLWAVAMAMAVVLTSGCGDSCSEAESLCEECEVEGTDCSLTFADASADFCEDAVAAYEASCPGG